MSHVRRILSFAPRPHLREVARLLGAVLFALTAVASASAQTSSQGPWGMNYSDTWMVGANQPTTDADGNEVIDGDAPPPSATIRGYGSYEDSYSMYGHQGSIRVTIRSPSGRTSTSASNGGTYVRSDVGLPFVDGDLGDFTTSHDTTVWCNGVRAYLGAGNGRSGRRIGASISTYELAEVHSPGHATYKLIQPCDVTCVGSKNGNFLFFSFNRPFPQYITITEPFFEIAGFSVCEDIIAAYVEGSVRIPCGDFTIF